MQDERGPALNSRTRSCDVASFELVSVDSNYPGGASILSELCTSTFTQAYRDVHSAENMHAYCSVHYSPQAITEQLLQHSTQAIMALSGDSTNVGTRKPAGFYLLRHSTSFELVDNKMEGRFTELKQIYILSDYYGSGLGLTLFHHATEQARQRQSRGMWLCFSNKNKRAQAFYAKLGFQPVVKGPELVVGSDVLSSTIMLLTLQF